MAEELSDLDEFLARAVDRQIAEQRALRETLEGLTRAVEALGAKPTEPSGPDLAAEIRGFKDSILVSMQRLTASQATPQPAGPPSPELTDDFARLQSSMTGVSADVEGIAQALIDLNAGLREWATGVDRGIADVRDAIEHQEGVARPLGSISPENVFDEIEKRMKESVELSLYLADQIEEFDRSLERITDLPARLEGILTQGMRRTLAASAKLDTQATTAVGDAAAALDSYVDQIEETIARFAESGSTLQQLGDGQAELATRLDDLYDAIQELAQGGDPKAASIMKPKAVRTSKPQAKRETRAPRKAKSKRPSRKTATPPPDDASAD